MLAAFPEILFLAPFAVFILRISVALIFALSAWAHIMRPAPLIKAWAVLEAGVALALGFGAWTQPAALVAAVWIFASLFVREMRIFPKSTMVLTLVISVCLLFLGPGALAFDWPL